MTAVNVDWAPLALRLILGILFIAHGYPKLKNLKGTASWLASIGFRPGIFWALVLSITELGGGIAILAGLAVRIASALLIVAMAIATLLKAFKWKMPFTKMSEGAGYEFDLVILAGLIALLFLGAGNWSVDQMIGWIVG